jgi:virginiamycin A acetyltransferase
MGIKRDIKKAIRKYVLAFLELSYLKENPPFLLKSTKYLKVGFNSYHNGNLKVKGANKMIVIGSYCALGENITILKSNHNYNYASIQYSFYNENFGELPYKENINDTPIIEIGNDVWIGDNVTILPGVIIGNGVCIGAGSIVTKSILPYSIAAGVPCKTLKMRFSESTIKEIEERKWWNYSHEEIKENRDFFLKNLNDNS